jgi:hypothetical protein
MIALVNRIESCHGFRTLSICHLLRPPNCFGPSIGSIHRREPTWGGRRCLATVYRPKGSCRQCGACMYIERKGTDDREMVEREQAPWDPLEHAELCNFWLSCQETTGFVLHATWRYIETAAYSVAWNGWPPKAFEHVSRLEGRIYSSFLECLQLALRDVMAS